MQVVAFTHKEWMLFHVQHYVQISGRASESSNFACAGKANSRSVFNAGGTFYALENYCPHQGASLAEGWVEGTTVTCPWHAWCFNLTDGTMTLGSFARVDPYDVRVEEGQVSVSRTPRAPEPKA